MNEIVWLRRDQMAELFGRDRSVIGRHIRNVFSEGELLLESNVQNLHISTSGSSDEAHPLVHLQGDAHPECRKSLFLLKIYAQSVHFSHESCSC